MAAEEELLVAREEEVTGGVGEAEDAGGGSAEVMRLRAKWSRYRGSEHAREIANTNLTANFTWQPRPHFPGSHGG